MASHRQDFVEREIARLRTFVATLSPDTAPAEIERALRLALDLQTGLFPLPAAEFLALEAPAQLEKLSAGQHPDEAAERRGKFIELLTHTAGLYALLGRDDFAAGARRHALHLALLDDASGPTDASARLVELLRAGLDEAALSAPVRSLLASFDGRAD